MNPYQKIGANEADGERLPRFNHYVPEFILNNFAPSGKVCVFDKHTLKEFKLPPRRAMGERDYNNVRMDDVVVSFENRFTHIENLAAPIISEIIKTKTLDSLDAMDVAKLHLFVVVGLMRSKSRRLDQDLVVNEVRKRWPEAQLNPHPERISDLELAKLAALKATFDGLEELAKPLALKHLMLMVRDCKDNLYISDNPLVMHDERSFGPYGNIGLAVPGVEIYYPLSPNDVLAYLCPTSMKNIEDKQAEAEKYASSFFSRRMLSLTGISQADTLTLANLREEIQRGKNHYHLMKDKRLVPMDAQNVLYLNSLQVSSSHRFIAAAKPDFQFAKRAIHERPHWKEGVRIQVA